MGHEQSSESKYPKLLLLLMIELIGPSEMSYWFNGLISKFIIQNSSCLGTCSEIAELNATEQHWQEVNIGSSDGLLPDGSKPLPDLMLT